MIACIQPGEGCGIEVFGYVLRIRTNPIGGGWSIKGWWVEH